MYNARFALDRYNGEMKITPLKTHRITEKDKNLFSIFDKYLPKLSEKSVVAVSSKIIAVTQGRVEKDNSLENKNRLIEKEADFFLSPSGSKYHVYLTIKENILIPSAGIDESNADHKLVLWPENLQETVNKMRHYLQKRFNLKKIGLIIVDSKVTPLRWGAIGFCLAHSGFLGVKNLIGQKDLFDKSFVYTKENIRDGLAAAAAVTMGEGTEQTPLALIEELPFVEFQERNPSLEELTDLSINREDDLYAPLLNSVNWMSKKN